MALQKPLRCPLLRERHGALVGVGAGVHGAGGSAGGDAVSALQVNALRVVATLTGLRQLPVPGAVMAGQPRGPP